MAEENRPPICSFLLQNHFLYPNFEMFFNYLLLTNEQMETKREDVRLENERDIPRRGRAPNPFPFYSPYPKVLVPTLGMRQYPEWDTPNGTHFVHCLITHFQPLRSHHQFTISICRLRPPRILDPRPDSHLITDQKRKFGNQKSHFKSPM